MAFAGAIPPMCRCEPESIEKRVEDGVVVRVCTRCGASAICLSDALPDFVFDPTRYEVSVELSLELLKAHLTILKAKTGLTTPELLELARRSARVVLPGDGQPVHYQLREFVRAGLVVRVEPTYPHSLD